MKQRGGSNGSGADGGAELYDEVAVILERWDPMGLMPDRVDPELGPSDEYDPEATTIVARLGSARSREDLHRIVAEEFARWFDMGEAPAEALTGVAEDIWVVVEARLSARG